MLGLFSEYIQKLNAEFYQKYITRIYSTVFALLSFASIIIPISSYIEDSNRWKIILYLLIIPGLAGSLYALMAEKILNKTIKKMEKGRFIVEYGDIHKWMFPYNNPVEEYTVVIPVNNRLNKVAIPWESVGRSNHSYWLNHLFASGRIGESELQEICKRKLEEQRIYQPDENYEYPIGTCILIYGSEINQPRLNILLAAICYINQENQSDGNEEQFLIGTQGIVKTQVDMLYKVPMYLPVLYGGFAGRSMKKKSEDLIDMMYRIFKFSGYSIETDIHVIVYYKDKKKIPIL